MDAFTTNHLAEWAERNHPEREGDVVDLIATYIACYPKVIDRGDSWPTILTLAQRWATTREGRFALDGQPM